MPGPGYPGNTTAIAMGTDVIITSFNVDCEGFETEDLAKNPPHVFNMREVMDHFGCIPIDQVINGFYPSAVKINISSIEDTL